MSALKLVFATGNAHKIAEVNHILRGVEGLTVVSKNDIGCLEELPETTGTIPGNALQKAHYLYEKYGVDCFSEDTGLEIEALDGAPGVDTAHYSGSRDAQKNIARVLADMGTTPQRTARFRTVIALILNGQTHVFEGICAGHIRYEAVPVANSFGYDPIFQPDGFDTTFAEMSADDKAAVSHRGHAMRQLLAFLAEYAPK